MKLPYLPLILSALAVFAAVLIFSQYKAEVSSSGLPQQVDFNFHIRPILVKNCYHCHGPDSSSREADLRLDTFEGATALREGGISAVVPGHPGQSELIRRISTDDAAEMMPPPESKLSLSPQEKALLEKWIAQGAVWKPHWALIPPEKPAVPRVSQTEAVANEIDAFILQQLEQRQLQPAPPAGRNTLIRRLAYLLTGLPPRPDEIRKFMKDDSPEAYESMVDYYLGSPHFGERWARHWMDLVRYAETRGHEFDYPVPGAWQYRDYLIRAFNQDLPYDQLVREHLAGDLLDTPRWNPEDGRHESVLGTAFYAMAEGKHSPVDLKADEAERIDNLIDVTTKTFQGLTVACARCHDHKFDPIPTTDYYALYGVMASSRFTMQPARLTQKEIADTETLQHLKTSIRKQLADAWLEETVPAVQTGTGRKLPADSRQPDHRMIGDFREQQLAGWHSDGFAFGHTTTLGRPVFDRSGRLTALEEGKASSRQLHTGMLGALRSPDFVIEQDFIGIRALGKQSSLRIIIHNFQLIQDPIYGGLEKRVDHESWENYTFDVSQWKGHRAYIEILPGYYERHVYQLPPTAYIETSYAMAFDGRWPEVPAAGSTAGVSLAQAIQDWAAGNSSAAGVRLLNQALQQGKLSGRHAAVQKLQQQAQELAASLPDTAYFASVTEGFGINSPVFLRGDYRNAAEQPVHRRFLSALPDGNTSFSSPGSGRLELADAILSPDNPLTARVMVNRLWHHVFGRGIVETVDNFGLQGKLPTHPELLDFLAIRFREEGWSVKKMLRYILMSHTFRRSVATDSSRQDPDNLWLAGFPLRRLEAEAIRDAILAASGQLDTTLFGPPVAVHLTDFMQGRGRPETSGPLDGDGRRSVYLEVRRNFLSPMMLAFDTPVPFSTFGKRNVTNVPAQSLMLMNSPFVAEQAKHMAEKVAAQPLSAEEKIQWIYLRAFGRAADAEEVLQAQAFLQQRAQAYGTTEMGRDAKVWQDYCHTIFNMKEFIYLI